MRKIISREEKDKKAKRNQLIIGGILILLMVLSTLGYAFIGNDEEKSDKIEYNGIEFLKGDSGYWNFNIQGINFMTTYNPEEVADITFLSYSSINNYQNQPLYLISEFNEPNVEIGRNLNSFVQRINEACLDENCEKDLPIKNCSADNIIIIREPENESEGIYQEENCVFITANFENQTRYADAFLYKILGI